MSALQPTVRDLRVMRSRPRVLLGPVPDAGAAGVGLRRPPPPSGQSGRPPGSSRSPARVSGPR